MGMVAAAVSLVILVGGLAAADHEAGAEETHDPPVFVCDPSASAHECAGDATAEEGYIRCDRYGEELDCSVYVTEPGPGGVDVEIVVPLACEFSPAEVGTGAFCTLDFDGVHGFCEFPVASGSRAFCRVQDDNPHREGPSDGGEYYDPGPYGGWPCDLVAQLLVKQVVVVNGEFLVQENPVDVHLGQACGEDGSIHPISLELPAIDLGVLNPPEGYGHPPEDGEAYPFPPLEAYPTEPTPDTWPSPGEEA